MWFLGDPAFYDYYIIHDKEKDRLGLVGENLKYSECSFACNLDTKTESIMIWTVEIISAILFLALLLIVLNTLVDQYYLY